MPRLRAALLTSVFVVSGASQAHGAGGPLGIDHRLSFDDSGIWKRRNQVFLQDATALVVLGGALWKSDDSRLGHTYCQSVDSVDPGKFSRYGRFVALACIKFRSLRGTPR